MLSVQQPNRETQNQMHFLAAFMQRLCLREIFCFFLTAAGAAKGRGKAHLDNDIWGYFLFARPGASYQGISESDLVISRKTLPNLSEPWFPKESFAKT